MPRARILVGGVAVVLGFALIGVIVRTAFPFGDGSARRVPATALPRPVGGSTRFDPAAAQPGSLPPGTSLVATARTTHVRVYVRPARSHSQRVNARRAGNRRLPLVFAVLDRRAGWLKASLPTRPNLSTGWLRARDVHLSVTPFRLVIRLRAHRLLLLRHGRPILRTAIAKGRAVSPTPTGRYYITDLLRPPDPRGFYGPYAFGLSAHSPVYTSFDGGDGQIGIHGTNQPQALGHDVSHGCIRVSSRAISRMAHMVPIGTPVLITRS